VNSKAAGVILIFIGLSILVCLLGHPMGAGAWLLRGLAEEHIRLSSALLGLALIVIIFVLPFLGLGAYLIVRGQKKPRS
jgi:hypothetical protein